MANFSGSGAASGAAAGSVAGPAGMVVGGVLGGLFGGQSGSPEIATQRVEHVRPTLTPEEQAMQNFFINQVYGQLGQQSPLQGLIESYYGGGYQPMVMGQQPGYQPGIQQPQITPEQTRYQYEQTVRADRWGNEVLPALQRLHEIYQGRSLEPEEEEGFAGKLRTKRKKIKTKVRGAVLGAGKRLETIATQLGMEPQEVKNLYEEWRTNPQEVAQRYTPPAQPATAQLGPTQTATQPGFSSFRPETWQQQPQTNMPTTPEAAEAMLPQPSAQPYTPLGEVMQQSPEQLAAQYDILRQQGMRGIEDWYTQAARELEQRGIGQYGGLMGSPYQRDVGTLLGQRGRMQAELGQQLGLSQLQAQQQMPYGQLQALEDVRRFEAGQQLAQQAPWIGVGQQIYALPWGQTTTTTQQQPGPGIIPGAISGAYTGAGLAGMLSNWGNKSQLMTPPGTGGGTGGFQLAGAQRAYEQFNPWG